MYPDLQPRRRLCHLDQGIGCALFCTGYLRSVASEEKPTVVAIVDDDELIRDALHGLMKAAGFRSLAFASGEELLRSAALDRGACLISDISMPRVPGLVLQSE